MAIIKKGEQPRRIQIDLTGPQGNAFVLLGYAQAWLKDLGYDKEDRDAIMEDMKSSDYEHLVEVFDREFGTFCDLLR